MDETRVIGGQRSAPEAPGSLAGTVTITFTAICNCYYGGPARYTNFIEGHRYADALATSDMSVKVRLSRPVERRRGVPIPYRRRVQQVGFRRQSPCRIAESVGNIAGRHAEDRARVQLRGNDLRAACNGFQ